MNRKSTLPLILAWLKAVFDPGAQSIGLAARFLDRAREIRPDEPGTFRWLLIDLSRDVVLADRPPVSKNNCPPIPGLGVSCGELPIKCGPCGVPETLPGPH
jgi:hypothetical protein